MAVCVIWLGSLSGGRDTVEDCCVKLNPNRVGFDAIILPDFGRLCRGVEGIPCGVSVCNQDDVVAAFSSITHFVLLEVPEVGSCVADRRSHLCVSLVGGIGVDIGANGRPRSITDVDLVCVCRPKGRKSKAHFASEVVREFFDRCSDIRVFCGG